MNPEQCQKALNSALRYLSASQLPNGSWDGPVGSRLFESGLAGYVLSEDSPKDYSRILRYVESQNPEKPDLKDKYVKRYKLEYELLFNRFAAALCKGEKRDLSRVSRLVKERLATSTDEEILRKLNALAVFLVGEGLLNWEDLPETKIMKLKHFITNRDSARFKQWAYITYLCTAIKYLRDTGRAKDAKSMAQEVLSHQMENGSWSKHTFVTSLVLYTLQDFGMQNSATEKAKAYLREIQNPDGGFPPFKLPVWDTAFTLVSLEDAGNLGSVKDYAKKFLVENIHDSGWGWDTGVEAEYDSTSMAVHALDGMFGLAPVNSAIEYLSKNQKEDGSWGTWRRHEPGSPDVTAHCILALPKSYVQRRERAADYLINTIEGGTWLPHWFFDLNYGASQCALAVKAVYDGNIKLDEVHAFVKKTQNKDGGWGSVPNSESNPMSTAHAVLALATLGDFESAEDGAEWLVSRQKDGRWDGVACGIGPRPIRYSDYSIVHASCIWALSKWNKGGL